MEKQQRREAEEAAEAARTVIEVETIDEAMEEIITEEIEEQILQPGTYYIWVKDDNIWEVARRLRFKPVELMEHNDYRSAQEIKPGDILHLPEPRRIKALPPIRYEMLPEPRDMHVINPKGAKKWSFGNIRNWQDFHSQGWFPMGTNVHIAAVANVPVDDEEKPMAGFYLDRLSVGDDFQTTGYPRFTVGFRWTDLATGVTETHSIPVATDPPPPEPKKIEVDKPLEEKTMDVAPSQLAPDFDPAIVERRLEAVEREGLNKFKDEYEPFPTPVPCIAMLPDNVGQIDSRAVIDNEPNPHYETRFIWVEEFSHRRPHRRLYQHQELDIAGHFEVDDTVYLRPQMAAINGYWFGIPAEYLQTQATVYNDEVDAETRVATGQITIMQRLFWQPVAKTIYSPRWKKWTQHKNKTKE